MEEINENGTKIEIWSHWLERPEWKYKYAETKDLELASKIITSFIYGTKHDHEYIIKIETL